MGCILLAVFYLVLLALSWLSTCGILWIIAACFNITFSWSVSTGIWLVLLLIASTFNSVGRK